MSKLEVTIGQNVKKLRKQRRWTQSKLANKIGMSLDMIGRIERAQAAPSFNTVERLSSVFQKDPADLMSKNACTSFPSEHRKKHLKDLYNILEHVGDDDLRWVVGIVKAAIAPPEGRPQAS